MSTDVPKLVGDAVAGLGFELVDFDRSARGLVRVFIDHPDGISVEHCAEVSNHLTRLFAVENVDFDRLEVSSPGLDRPLKTLSDFQRFTGCGARVRLNCLVEARKRFDGEIESVSDTSVVFRLIDEPAATGLPKRPTKRATSVQRPASAGPAPEARKITVPVTAIERARLIPDL
jgi:ribosome maturation factor RimP